MMHRSQVGTRIQTGSLRAVRLVAGALALIGLLGCNAARIVDRPAVTPDDATPKFDTWKGVAPGMQRRDLRLEPYKSGVMHLVRLDPAIVAFRVLYDPDAPHFLPVWHERVPDAALIVNGSFFDGDRRALGLVASDGQTFGQSFNGFGGMFQVSSSGVRVRSLVSEPYGGEPLMQAVQAFPLLIEPGGIMARRGEGFDVPSRRTWIGQDAAGQIVIGVSHYMLTLAELQEVLFNSDLNLGVAFALDGGRSSGMVISVPDLDEHFPAFDRLPVVLAVYVP